ncbi:MAG: ABC transporter ATP-binding protein/permease [Deltaproteobacteria bacterium]|jgi:ATP-binding cassette subfamily B protein|nr:ABC transporter ATP-binding protein/permease [Deltaproteobacteria bacterium]
MLKKLYYISFGDPRRLLRPIAGAVVADICNILPYGFVAFMFGLLYGHYAAPGRELDWGNLRFLCCLMLFFLVVQFGGEIFAFRSMYRRAYENSAAGRAALAEHLCKLPLGFLVGKDPGELGNIMMNDFSQLENAISHILGQLVGGVITPLITLVFFLFVDWRMALAMFAALPFSFLLLWLVSGLERRRGKAYLQSKTVMANSFGEYIDGMKVIKAHHLQGANFRRLERAIHAYMKNSIAVEGLFGSFYLVAVAGIRSGLAWMSIAGVYLSLGGSLPAPVFALFLLVGTRVFDPLAAALMRLAEFKYISLSGERILNLMHQPLPGGEKDAPAAHDIVFENVSFRYGEKPVLENVSLSLRSGSLTALVGPSGSGKSTILRLIARFYDPQAGSVKFGGTDAREIDPEKLLKRISVVFQEVYLFQDSIGNNIRYGRQEATQEEIEEAAKAARCHEFITALPRGYDTLVGEGGSTLSGGEKQRVSIARAILKDAPVILLDEATASLDPENEAEVQRAIGALIRGRTVVMIAHRLQTVVGAGRIIVLNKGRIVGQGTHAELLAAGGLYAELWSAQQNAGGWTLE